MFLAPEFSLFQLLWHLGSEPADRRFFLPLYASLSNCKKKKVFLFFKKDKNILSQSFSVIQLNSFNICLPLPTHRNLNPKVSC